MNVERLCAQSDEFWGILKKDFPFVRRSAHAPFMYQKFLEISVPNVPELIKWDKRVTRLDRNVYTIGERKLISLKMYIKQNHSGKNIKAFLDQDGNKYVLWSLKMGINNQEHGCHFERWERTKHAYDILQGCSAIVAPVGYQIFVKGQFFTAKVFTPYEPRGDLYGYFCRNLTSGYQEKLKFIDAVLEAVGEVHARGIIHGDIKLENVVIGAEGKVKLIDFEMSCDLGAQQTWIGGTCEYFAPELANFHYKPDQKTDIWGIGCIFYELLWGEKISSAKRMRKLADHIPNHPDNPRISELLHMMLQIDPQKRMDIAQLRAKIAFILVHQDENMDESSCCLFTSWLKQCWQQLRQ